MLEFRVVDLKTEGQSEQAQIVKARTPEGAARQALGVSLVRSGRPARIRARVYFQDQDQALTMVRLYEQAVGEPINAHAGQNS